MIQSQFPMTRRSLAAVLVLAWASTLSAGNLKVDKDIVFGKGADVDLKLDVYRPADQSGRLPGVLVLYGGAWRGGNKEIMRIVGEQLAGKGFVAVCSQYRLCPKYKFPAQIEDSKCAVRWMRASADAYGIDPDRIGSFGFSAGGHLALLLGLMDKQDGLEGSGGHAQYSSKVQAVVNYFGPVDMTLRDWLPKDERLLIDFLGGSIDERPDLYRLASPATYIDSNDPPVLTFHGTKDPLVPYGQAILLDHLLRAKKVPSRLHPVVGGSHGWWGLELQETQRESIEFFNAQLKKPR